MHAACSLHPKLRAGLRRDLSAWAPRSITRHALDVSATGRLRESDITAAFGIFNNSLYWLNPEAHPLPRNPHLYAIADDLRTLLSLFRVPNVEFLLNVDDYPKSTRQVPTVNVKRAPRIPLPLFSYTKREREGSGASFDNADVLVPSGAFRMSLFEAKLLERSVGAWEHRFPWASKRSAAFFRGTPYCGTHHNFGRCSRYVLAHLTQQNASAALDVGLVEYNPAHDSELRRTPPPTSGPLRKAARLPESVYSSFKWLLHLDGHSFSNRLQVDFASIQFISIQFRSLPPNLTSLDFTSPHLTSLHFTSLHFTSLGCRRCCSPTRPCSSRALITLSTTTAVCLWHQSACRTCCIMMPCVIPGAPYLYLLT